MAWRERGYKFSPCGTCSSKPISQWTVLRSTHALIHSLLLSSLCSHRINSTQQKWRHMASKKSEEGLQLPPWSLGMFTPGKNSSHIRTLTTVRLPCCNEALGGAMRTDMPKKPPAIQSISAWAPDVSGNTVRQLVESSDDCSPSQNISSTAWESAN